jgi:hypothetical protein
MTNQQLIAASCSDLETDERARSPEAGRLKQQQADNQAAELGRQRSQLINGLIASIDPETCASPGWTSKGSQIENMQIQSTIDQGVAHCQQVRLSRNAAIQQQQAQMLAAQQEAQRIEYAAQQQALTNTANDLQSVNSDFRQQFATKQCRT